MRNNQINWLAILVEAFFLVLGVLLALAATNWREDNKKKQSAEIALQSIAEELASNHQQVTEALLYHGQIMDTLYKHMRAYPGPSAPVPSGDVFPKGFMNPASPLSGAWEAAIATGVIENASYEKVRMVSQVYEMQEQYDVQSQAVGQQIYGRMFEEGMSGILKNYRNLAQIVGAFFYTECGLLTEYAAVVPALRGDSTQLAIPQFCQNLPAR